MKKQVLLLLALMLPKVAGAVDVVVDGINYTLNDGATPTAVVNEMNPAYSGDVVIPKSFDYGGKTYVVTDIATWAFSSCENLTSLSIPATVNEIGDCMVSYSGGLQSITVDPDNLVYDSRDNCNAVIETKSNKLIAGCNNTVIPASVVVIGGCAFQDMDGLTSLVIPSSVTTIESDAFNMCDGITTLEVPNSVTTIEYGAFSWMSNLKSVTIGTGVTAFVKGAFQDCHALSSLTLKATTPPTASSTDDPFYSYPNATTKGQITLYVPASAVDAYKADPYWSTFKEIVALPNQCATPTINYANGKVTFSCETEGVEFHSTISKTFSGTEVDADGDYTVSVYATKDGYGDSDVATAVVKLGADTGGSKVKGDVNGDGKVTVTDAVQIVDIVLKHE